ncbi:MAG: S41 family peptidase [Caldilineaceae bacterium]
MTTTALAAAGPAEPVQGYYRFPTLHCDTIIFTAEGDLWKVSTAGGQAQRLTTHHGIESCAAISPDGAWVAFSAEYEGPTEVYVISSQGGRPRRLTYEGLDEDSLVAGWTPDGKVLYSTKHFSTLPNRQLVVVDPVTLATNVLPLSQASEGVFTPDGATLFFTRLPPQSSNAKRYQGGSVQNLWKFSFAKRRRKQPPEAIPLTADYAGTSKAPMWWEGRVYFLCDRDGTMNLWSMNENGRRLLQHTFHKGWDIQSPSLHQGRIVYQLGADLRLYTIANGDDQLISITLVSDFEHTRERWINHPWRYLTALHLSPDGDRVALTARGRVFVAPAKQGRLVEVSRRQGVRYRDACFLPDGHQLLMLSDESGEVEFWRAPTNGVGDFTQLTSNGAVFRYAGAPSPDGQWMAYDDKDHRLWLLNLSTLAVTQVAQSDRGAFGEIVWSPDSRWLAYVKPADNRHKQIWLYALESAQYVAATTDRLDSYAPTWSGDGKWLYFLSDRQFRSLVDSPWGPRQPDPYFDKTTKVYMLALAPGERSPFLPVDELFVAQQNNAKQNNGPKPEAPPSPAPTPAEASKPNGEGAKAEAPKPNGEGAKAANGKGVTVAITVDGLAARLQEAPLTAANYTSLAAAGKFLFWTERDPDAEARLFAMEIKNQDLTPVVLATGVTSYVLSQDGKKILVRKGWSLYIIDATADAPKDLEKLRVPLGHWSFAVDPREEWRQMLVDAWRLQRDYFYDRNLHGLDWQGLLQRYMPLVDRVTDRDELNDLIAQLMSELSALHTSVWTNDVRRGQDRVDLASLGAQLVRDDAAGGYVVQHIYQTDPDYPDRISPLAAPEANLRVGDVITAINGLDTLAVEHPALLLKNKNSQQVLLRVRSANAAETEAANPPQPVERDVIVRPISSRQAANLRYDAWEYEKRCYVEKASAGAIGYLHLRAMSGENYAEWTRDYYPVYNRQGLIIDVRHNRGGNIDSWLLGKLLRQPWVYWQPRVGKPYWNMQYAFHGHMVVLCNEHTASDGESFSEGFRRLGLGKVIGTRTWGGGIWLSYGNRLVDSGIASAPQIGMYTAEGEWLIEGHGVEPDIVVDNLPHATFLGQDAQLDAALAHLQELIRTQPITVPEPPPYPEKVFRYE